MATVRVRAIIPYENTVFLVKHPGSAFYSLPGGKVDPGESSIHALRREIMEELGVSADIGALLFVHEFLHPKGERSFELFFAVDNGQDFVSSLLGTHAHEIEDFGFFAPGAVDIKPEELSSFLLEICAGRREFIGHICR